LIFSEIQPENFWVLRICNKQNLEFLAYLIYH